MDDSSTWETAAAIAAICVGLGGLLVFSLVAMIAAWRVANAADRASREATRASLEVDALSRALAGTSILSGGLQAEATGLSNPAVEADPSRGRRVGDANAQQLAESRVLREAQAAQARQVAATIRRLDESIEKLSAALERLGGRRSSRGG